MAVISKRQIADKLGVDDEFVQHLVKKMPITKIGVMWGPKSGNNQTFTCDEDAFFTELESLTANRIARVYPKKVDAGKAAGATREKKKEERRSAAKKTMAKAKAKKAKKTPPEKEENE